MKTTWLALGAGLLGLAFATTSMQASSALASHSTYSCTHELAASEHPGGHDLPARAHFSRGD